ncbi:MAG: DUF5132 domain-containing protein [Pseudomonadota bacterium]
MFLRGFIVGAAVTAGGMLLIPGVAVAVARASRPVARAAVRTGTVAYTEFRRAGAEAYEHFEDIAAEVQADLHAEQAEAEGSARPASATGRAGGGEGDD